MSTKVLVIVGPTAVGKTALSIEIAQKFSGEIISGDSMQVYEALNIGTAKVSKKEQAGIPHYLLDCLPWDKNYSAFDFKNAALKIIPDITERNHLPMVVGGTGLYIQSLLEGYNLGEGTSLVDDKKSKEELWEELEKKEPALAKTTHENNERRVRRALSRGEVTNDPTDFDVFMIGLTCEREKLYDRINQRVDQMVKEGLLKEARALYEYQKNFSEKLTVVQAIGYKEFFPYFKGEISLEEAISLVKRNSRRYAKRQLTWFSNRMEVPFYNLIDHPEEKEKLMEKITHWWKGGNDD